MKEAIRSSPSHPRDALCNGSLMNFAISIPQYVPDTGFDPDAFGAWGFEALLTDRLPRYQMLADRYGYTVEAADVATVRDGDEFLDLVAGAIRHRMR